MKSANIFLVVLAATLTPNAYAQAVILGEDIYNSAYKALIEKDCVTALQYLEKFKIEAASTLKSRPNFAKTIDLQIEDCRDKTILQKSLRLRADLNETINIAEGPTSGTGVDTAAGGISGTSIAIPIIILLLLIIL